MSEELSNLAAVKARYQGAQQKVASARALVEQAGENAKKAEQELAALGFDTNEPIEPQIEKVYDEAVSLLERVEKEIDDAHRILRGNTD